MIDLRNVEKYRENNRIEAKKALGGLPHSIWETYSAFANTLGGVILLGVEEYRNKTFHVVDLPDPEGMIAQFKAMLADRKKVSANILSDRDITIESFEGKRFIAINIPRAHRFDKPLFVDGNPFGGTYRRGGEGDYKCTREEVEGMQRDARRISSDMLLYDDLKADGFEAETVGKYFKRLKNLRGEYAENLENESFLEKIGAIAKGADDIYHPTAAGLLMFGKKEKTAEKFPSFKPKFIEKNDVGEEISSFECENLFEYYLMAECRILRNICMFGMSRSEEEAIGDAVWEALANSIIHADYHGDSSLCIEMSPYVLSVTNPGSLRIAPDAIFGGVSDRRNAVLAKMFYLVGIGSGGIRGIYEVWRKKKWCAPAIIEAFKPDSVTLKLTFGKSLGGNICDVGETASRREAVINYITEHIEATSSDIAALLGISRENALVILKKLSEDKILTYEKRGNTYFYKLRS